MLNRRLVQRKIESLCLNCTIDHIYFKSGDQQELFAAYKKEVQAWGDSTGLWIMATMGVAARSRFFDSNSPFPNLVWDSPFHPEFSNYKNHLKTLRGNLIRLIESPSWDQ